MNCTRSGITRVAPVALDHSLDLIPSLIWLS